MSGTQVQVAVTPVQLTNLSLRTDTLYHERICP